MKLVERFTAGSGLSFAVPCLDGALHIDKALILATENTCSASEGKGVCTSKLTSMHLVFMSLPVLTVLKYTGTR